MIFHLYDGVKASRHTFAGLSSSFASTTETKTIGNDMASSGKQNNTTNFFSRRRVVVMEEPLPHNGRNTAYFFTEEEKTQSFRFDMPPASTAASNRFVLDKDLSGCDYMEDWQRQIIARPTCNVLHEFHVRMSPPAPPMFSAHMDPWNRGSRKQVWTIYERGIFQEKLLLKTNHNMESDEDAEFRYADAKEGLIMDQCTSSSHVMDLLGWCFQSSLVERADGKLSEWVHTHVFDPAREDKGQIRPEISDRIVRIAIALTKSLADIQLVRYEGDVPKVVHGDIKLAQYLFKDTNDSDVGLDVAFQLGDFNWAHLLTANKNATGWTGKNDASGNRTVCPFPETKGHRTLGRSPEEMTKGSPLTDKIDLSTLASIFYWMLTSNGVYQYDYSNTTDSTSAYVEGVEISFSEATRMIRAAVPPSFPLYITQSRDQNIQALVKVILACKQLDPSKRPMPKDIISFLQQSLAMAEN
jgi:hypothetical protein